MGNLLWTPARDSLLDALPADLFEMVRATVEAAFNAEYSAADINRMRVVADIARIREILEDAALNENEITTTRFHDDVRNMMWEFEVSRDASPPHIFTRLEALKARNARVALERRYDPDDTLANRLAYETQYERGLEWEDYR